MNQKENVAMSNTKVKTTIWNKPVGYTSPVQNHNSGRQLAMKTRKNYVVSADTVNK